jgi:hypothetical protein
LWKAPNGTILPANDVPGAKRYKCGACDGIGMAKQGVAEGKADYNFDIEDLKRLEQIRDLSTLKAQALALISKPSAKPMKPEKVEWFKNALERMNSPLKVIKLMYDLLLSGEGKAVVGSRSSMNPNSYRQRFSEQSMAEDLSRRGFLRGLGAAALGAAGVAATGNAQARATPEWYEKVARAKELLSKGLTPEQVAKKLGVTGPNNNMAGPMGGDWGAINYAAREVQRSRGTGTNEDYNPEYDDEAGMADNNLETLHRAVDGIDDVINTGDNLPEWCQEKIAVAKSMLVSVWDYMRSEQDRGANPELAEEFDLIESCIDRIADHNGVDAEMIWEDLESLSHDELYVFAVTSEPIMEDWQKANKKDRTAGMSQKAVNAYRRENPGSKLQTAVTTKPSKLKKGSKASKRRKSYCSRSRGQMKMHNISCAKTPDKAICKARRRWNC